MQAQSIFSIFLAIGRSQRVLHGYAYKYAISDYVSSSIRVQCLVSIMNASIKSELNHCGTLQADIWHAALLEQTVNWHKQLPFLEHGGVLRFRDVTVGLYSSARAAQPHRFVTPNSVSIFTLSSG